MADLDRLVDELGYMPGVGSQDDPPPARFELRREVEAPTTNLHGHAPSTVAAVHAAIDQEDQPSQEEELDLFLRRYRMEKALTSAEKDKLIVEMAAIINRITDIVSVPPDDKAYGSTVFAARMIARHPGIGVDTICLSSAIYRATGKWTSLLTEVDVSNWKPYQP